MRQSTHRKFLGERVADPNATTYRPVIILFAITALMALADVAAAERQHGACDGLCQACKHGLEFDAKSEGDGTSSHVSIERLLERI